MRLLEYGNAGRHPGADHHQVDLSRQRRRLIAGVQLDAHPARRRRGLAEPRLVLAIAALNPRAVGQRQLRRGQTATAQPDDQDRESRQVGLFERQRRTGHRAPHRSLSVASDINEKINATIQKRITTFDSLQPANSKW